MSRDTVNRWRLDRYGRANAAQRAREAAKKFSIG
jgi:hypothetical protein